MVKRKYYYQFLTECIAKLNGKDICIWGARRTGRALFETIIENKMIDLEKVHVLDKARFSSFLEIENNKINIESPDEYITKKDNYFIICAAENPNTAFRMSEYILGINPKKDIGITENYANFYFYIEDIVKSSPELIKEERDEYDNLIATLYTHQNYGSDLIVDDEYKNSAVISTKIGCPIQCKYCPQDVLINKYLRRKNPVLELSYEKFVEMLNRIPKNVIISFTGFVEPFANKKCLDMVLYTLNNGYEVRVYSTLYNVSIEDYIKFKDYKNLKTLDIHLPDSNKNTVFPITESYKELLRYIVKNPPKYARLWTSCLGIHSHTREEIRDIISVHGNPINSIHGLVYDNRLSHGPAKLKCNRDCSRIDNPKAGVGMILPNGDVVACTQDWELQSYIGNIFEVNTWDELMQGELRMKFRDALSDPNIDNICTYCELAIETDQGDKI